MDLYQKVEKVGEGTYGKVYKVMEKATGKIRLPEDDEGVTPSTLHEVALLQMLSMNPHVVRLLDLKHGQNKEGNSILYLLFEYMDTDLNKYISSFSQKGEMVPLVAVKGHEASQSFDGSKDNDAKNSRPWTETLFHYFTQELYTRDSDAMVSSS